MKQRYLLNIVFLLFVNAVVKPIWIFGIDRTVQNTVGTDYGLYFTLFNFALIFQILVDFGLNNFNTRAIARNEQLVAKFVPAIFSVKMLLGVVYAMVLMLAAFSVGYAVAEIKLLLLLGFNQLLLSYILFFRSNITAFHWFKLDALVSVLDKILMIGIVGYLLLFNQAEFSIEWFVYAQSAALAITCVLATIPVYKKGGVVKLNLNWYTTKKMLKMSTPFAVVGILMSIYTRIDAVMLHNMVSNGSEAVAKYAASYRLLDATNIIGYSFATILLPVYARKLKLKESLASLVQLSLQTILTLAIGIALGSLLFASEILDLLYSYYQPSWDLVFQLLMPGFIGIAIMYVIGALFTAAKMLKVLNIIAAIGLVVNVLLNAILIPNFEAAGAAFATLITEGIVAVSFIAVLPRYFNIRFRWKNRIQLLCFGALSMAGGIAIKQLAWPFLLSVVLFGVATLLLAFIFKLIQPRLLIKGLQ